MSELRRFCNLLISNLLYNYIVEDRRYCIRGILLRWKGQEEIEEKEEEQK